MIPTDAARLTGPIYLDTTFIDWATRRRLAPHLKSSDQDLYATALTDFGRESRAEQRILRDTIEECIRSWKAKADANRTAINEITQLGADITTVGAPVESIDAEPKVFSKTDLLELLVHATEAFEKATHQAIIRLKALEAVMIRRAILGRHTDFEPEPLHLPAGISVRQPRPLSTTDRRNYEIILQLESRTFHSPTQYFREIGRRCVSGRGKPVGYATINGWFKKEGLYVGREDGDIAALQARAVARAKKVLAVVEGNSPDLLA